MTCSSFKNKVHQLCLFSAKEHIVNLLKQLSMEAIKTFPININQQNGNHIETEAINTSLQITKVFSVNKSIYIILTAVENAKIILNVVSILS